MRAVRHVGRRLHGDDDARSAALALLAVYAILRRIVRSSLLALALFLPFLATSFFLMLRPLDDRYALGRSSACARCATAGRTCSRG